MYNCDAKNGVKNYNASLKLSNTLVKYLRYKRICYKLLKDLHSCLILIIKILTDKGQFQYLTGCKGPQEGTYLDTTQFLFKKININVLSESN